MSCYCCVNPLIVCEEICPTQSIVILPITAPTDGTYTIKTRQFGQPLAFIADMLAGQPLSFILQGLNEWKAFNFSVYDSAGSQMPLLDGEGVDRECFQLTTRPQGAQTLVVTW